jgi:4-alpha-glucanotransferase
LETGEIRQWTCKPASLPIERAAKVEKVAYAARRISLSQLPYGYHQLELEIGERGAETLVVSAPRKAFVPKEEGAGKTWGVFLPLHALQSRTSWGTGDFADLGALTEWVRKQGGGVVATLPLLAAFLDEPLEPSPYMPASRLFWNECFLNIESIPELTVSPAAKALLGSGAFRRDIDGLRAAPLVDYRRGMALKRRVLSELSRTLRSHEGLRWAAFQEFVGSHPLLQDYARFRATGDRLRSPWPTWSQRQRSGELREGDYEEDAQLYHLYVQWLAHQQLQTLADKAHAGEPGLYLDLPLGVHPDSFDVWRERTAFAHGVSAGAPPDRFFTQGQDWGFRPLHPQQIREQGYRHFIACLRHHLAYASILRIDHVMGLHRLFWIPNGMKAIEGVYVGYRPEEFYAILALESVRSQTLIVGEDLGTVPPSVRPAMARHDINRSYVVQHQIKPKRRSGFSIPSANSLASVNTHDMATFAGFWEGQDIQVRAEMGLLDEAGALVEQKRRTRLKNVLVAFLRRGGWLAETDSDPKSVLGAAFAFLGASPARAVIINLEDLWGEVLPQNVPGTGAERPNWKRKARYALEDFCQKDEVLDTLRAVNAARKKEAG